MKALGIFVLTLMGLVGISALISYVLIDYHYQKEISDYWTLSIKASTLQQKSAYLDTYIAGLEKAPLGDNDALVFKRPDNSSEQNLIAIKSLQSRMHEALKMDENSFAYQQAIQQITSQEQDENHSVINILESCWYKANHPFFWDGYFGIVALIWVLLVVFGVVAVAVAD